MIFWYNNYRDCCSSAGSSVSCSCHSIPIGMSSPEILQVKYSYSYDAIGDNGEINDLRSDTGTAVME